MKITGKCCICGGKYVNYGKNSAPIKSGRCCADCETKFVIPAKIREICKATLKRQRKIAEREFDSMLDSMTKWLEARKNANEKTAKNCSDSLNLYDEIDF